ncbi:MAG: MFS transporter [Candidatus Aminicenantes bacterium]|nr:MFS transporter [Candidatus Aminicenantes bacterium]
MKEKILLSASLFHALNDGATVVVPMVFPLLYNQGFLITSYSQIGLLSNLGLLATVLVQVLVVHLSYAHEYRRLLAFSLAGISLTLVLLTQARTFTVLVLLYLLLRIAMSFYHPIVIAWISKSHPEEVLDSAMGIQSGSGNVGVFLAFLLAGYLAQRWTWQTPLIAWAVLGLGLGMVGLLALRGVSSREEGSPSLDIRAWGRVLKSIKVYIPGFIFGGLGWSVSVYYAPSLLNHKFGVPLGGTGLILALWIGLGTLSGYSYGWLSRRFGRRPVFLVAVGGGVLSLFVIGLATSKSAAVAGILGLGAFLLLTYPSLHTFVGSSTPPRAQTLAFSWVANIQLISGAVVTLLAGLLSDRFGIRVPFLLAGGLALAVFLFYAFFWPVAEGRALPAEKAA